ncbi:glycosyltransferase [Hymenobacter sp. BT559]|uniref:glycosyltransferase n=1 Tax=Hymenobacter sp. BT559 TaxID=2795729 RepID=UPI0018EB8D2A|nr:glycosyltransferase [Hymenobacter sp. BT559]MBJ6144837.1 glycosyltransferase [Hymenobacter sp. BT559]
MMNVLYVSCVVYCVLWLGWLGYIMRRLATRAGAPAPEPLPAPLPRVSIFIAARNEEAALPRCLASVRALQYPAHLLEVLVGDDASTDSTRAVAEAAMQGFAGSFRVVTITGTLGQARGKANVLAHLAHLTTTDFWLLTDADIALPTTWVHGLLAHAAPRVGTVTGLTVVQGPSLLAKLQGVDWLLSLGAIQVATDSGQPMTAMGNNMLVTRAAYQATGGYEAMPATIIEDFALFEAVNAQGYGFRQLFEPAVRASSLPAGSWAALLRQRLRWVRGVAALPRRVQVALVLFSGYWVAVAGLLLLGRPDWALGVMLLKICAQALMLRVATRRAGLPMPAAAVVVGYEFFSLALTTHLALSRLFGRRGVDWKGRHYH